MTNKVLEVCTSADDISKMQQNISTSLAAGAQRIELCSHMKLDGLTPNVSAIKAAKSAMDNIGELLVMVRPHNHSFCYNNNELTVMAQQISLAAQHQADGVVIGALDHQNQIDLHAVELLVNQAIQHRLSVTFHRAFDAIADPERAVEQLKKLGINRLLTSGNRWGSQQANMPNISQLTQIADYIGGAFELVIGGGVNIDNANRLWQLSKHPLTRISLHSYSGVLDGDGNIMPAHIKAILR